MFDSILAECTLLSPKWWLLLALILPTLSYGQSWSGILAPTSGAGACPYGTTSGAAGCAIDWSVVGIRGGIPPASAYTQAGSTITATGSDQMTAINSALNSCNGTSSSLKYVNLAAGTFKTSGPLIVKSYCKLHGQGADQTIIQNNGTSGAGIVQLGTTAGASPGETNDTAITGGLTAGSTTITVASAAHISVGTNLSISELNSSVGNVNSTGSEGFCGFCDNYGGFRSSGQTVLVTGVSGTTITISPGLYWTYGATLPSWATGKHYTGQSITNGGHWYLETATPAAPFNCTSGASIPAFSTSGGSVTDGTGATACVWQDEGVGTTTAPVASPFTPTAIEAGVDNVQLYTVNAGTTPGVVGPNVVMNMCQECFVHGIEANYTDSDFVYAFYDWGGEISNNYFSNAIWHSSGDYDSCVQLSTGVSQMLVQNNIVERPHVGILIEHQASGNVLAYNYMEGGYAQDGLAAVIGGIDFHGAHPQFNLLEGNVGPQIYTDSVWGTSANTTAFRNWSQGSTQSNFPLTPGRATVTGNGATTDCNSITTGKICFPFQASRAMQITYLSTGTNLIGNVVGSVQQSANIGYGSGVTPYNSGSGQTDALRWPITRIFDTTVYGYTFGYGESGDDGTWPLDSATSYTTSLLHGNYGNISNAIVWSGSLTHTLPASFYLSSKPAWWTTGMPYPSIGPDVTGQSGPGGHTSLTAAIPAQNCYLSIMGGTIGGAGSPLTFNADTCYPAAASSGSTGGTVGPTGMMGSVARQ